jgi:transcriptional regulator with XRE-family HTH domain
MSDNKSLLEDVKTQLKLTHEDLAHYLGVTTRTISRWVADSNEIPLAAACAMKAWLKLNKLGCAWNSSQREDYLEKLLFGKVYTKAYQLLVDNKKNIQNKHGDIHLQNIALEIADLLTKTFGVGKSD